MRAHDSKCGWVLMSSPSRRRSCYSFSTLLVGQNNIIELRFLNSEFRIATFSSNPSQEDCLILALRSSPLRLGVISISTCRPGDTAWITQVTQHFECDFPLHEVNHTVYFRGIFYLPSCRPPGGIIGTYNVAEQNWAVLEPKRSRLITYTRDKFLRRHVRRVKTDNDGELPLVLEDFPPI